ncbi:hypothetical protein ON010_g9678 [Phytophthora cinnamomi]|nr:hypothetical protein ON010_g9678 [Phytophthora cinnamomi]
MFLGYVVDSDGVFTKQTAALAQLKVLYVKQRELTTLDCFDTLAHNVPAAAALTSHLDLNPVAVVNEHAFETTPSLELMYCTAFVTHLAHFRSPLC